MVKKKQPYESPEIKATQVEIESSICSGSVEFENPNESVGKIEAQEVNTDFGYDLGSDDWTIGNSSSN